MAQDTLFEDTVNSPVGEQSGCGEFRFATGDRYTFRGLVGQEAFEQRLPGSGSVGWVIEVMSISPTGTIGFRCAETAQDVTRGRISSVGLADATEMVRQGVWVRQAGPDASPTTGS